MREIRPYGSEGWGTAGSCEEIENRLLPSLSVRSAHVFTCGFEGGTDQGWLNSIVSQLPWHRESSRGRRLGSFSASVGGLKTRDSDICPKP